MNKKESYGQTPFWRRKIRILHSHLDVNKDGIINYDDFMLQIERFSKIRDFSTEATIEFIKILTTLWGELWREVNPYNLISIEKYIEEMHHAIDKGQNGKINIKELKLFFKCLGLENDHAVISFNYIDINENGKLILE